MSNYPMWFVLASSVLRRVDDSCGCETLYTDKGVQGIQRASYLCCGHREHGSTEPRVTTLSRQEEGFIRAKMKD